MKRSTLFASVACGPILLVIAGCAAEPAPRQPTTVLSASPDRPTATTPTVADPLDITRIRTEPCTGLTHGQLAPYLGTIRKQEPQFDTKSLACDWYAVDGNRNSVSLFIYPDTSVTEMHRASLGFSYFNRAGPLTDGYPTVRKSQLANGPRNGDCITEVAVSERETIAIYAYTINTSDPNHQNMCSVSDRLVQLAVDNLRSGG